MPSRASLDRARLGLTSLWTASFILLLLTPAILLVRGTIEADETLLSWFDHLSATYVPFLGTIIAYHFSIGRKLRSQSIARASFLVAMVASIVWNATILALVVPTLWGGSNLDVAGERIQVVGGRLAWLVAPALGHFFGRSHE